MIKIPDPNKAYNDLPFLPPKNFIETNRILKQLIKSHKALAELKGYSELLPNKNIILGSITIKEAKDSSEIENIITTHDEIYKSLTLKHITIKPETKEVINYRRAIYRGYELIKKHWLLSMNTIIEIQKIIQGNDAGIRKLPGTKLINDRSKKVYYTPPDQEEVILSLLKNLESFINTDNDKFNPLTKLALIHYQFEAIHPFYDANGRTGRIINVLYLVLKKILNEPFLYLSGYLIEHKGKYYELLRNVTYKDQWEEWVLFMLKAMEKTSLKTLAITKRIAKSMEETSETIKTNLPKIYSRELVDILYSNVYTKISNLVDAKIASRNIASNYLNRIESLSIIESKKIGREKIFINKKLFDILRENHIH